MPDTLYGVQALRGVAALLVVMFHAAAIWREGVAQAAGQILPATSVPKLYPGPWDQGWAGVDLFFVISGFIMVWIAPRAAQRAGAVGQFIYRRLTRIYPLWWVYCGLMGLYFWVAYGQPASPVLMEGPQAWRVLLDSLLLVPNTIMPVLSVGWTLMFELAFYALFAALLLVPSRFRVWGFGVWVAVIGSHLLIRGVPPSLPDTWMQIVTHPLSLEFSMGAGVAWAARRVSPNRGLGVGLTALGVAGYGVSMMIGIDADDPNQMVLRVAYYGVPAMLILFGLVTAERAGGLSVPRSLQRLGDASYTLYLAHILVLLALKRTALSLGLIGEGAVAMLGFAVVGVGVSVAVSLIAYAVLERPLLSLSRKWGRRFSSRNAVTSHALDRP